MHRAAGTDTHAWPSPTIFSREVPAAKFIRTKHHARGRRCAVATSAPAITAATSASRSAVTCVSIFISPSASPIPRADALPHVHVANCIGLRNAHGAYLAVQVEPHLPATLPDYRRLGNNTATIPNSGSHAIAWYTNSILVLSASKPSSAAPSPPMPNAKPKNSPDTIPTLPGISSWA